LENSYQKFAKDVLIIGVTNGLVALSSLILLPLLTKTLGAYDYGIWAQVQVTISLVLGFVSLGLPYAMTRFLPAKTDREEIRDEFYSVFCVVFLAAAIVSIILIVFANFIAGAFFAGATDIVRITGLIILVWSLDNVFLNFFRTFRQMKKYSIFMIANIYGQVGLIAYLVLSGYGILSIVLAVLATEVVILFILSFQIRSQLAIKRPHFSKIREYLSFSLPTIPGTVSSWVVASSDRYVIAYFLGATSVGIYSAAYGIGTIPLMAAEVLGFVLPPTLSKLYDEGRMTEVKTHLSYSLKYLLALVIPFVFGAAVLAEPVLRLFSTPEIASQGYLVLPIVALSTLFFVVGSIPTQILFLVRKTKIIGIAWIAAALINLVLNILIVPYIGILGAAITTLIAYLLALGIRTYYAFKEFKFDIQWRFIIKSVVASAIMALAIWRMSPQGNVTTILTIVAGTTIYGGILFLLKGLTKEELRFFKGILQTRP
jgi:O-antigen/teichoic acid export membrane protein